MALPPLSMYHQDVLAVLTDSGAASAAQVAELEVLLRGLSGDVAADGPQIWRHVAERVLLPCHPFAVHLRLAAAVYDGWPAAALGRPPLWLPHGADAASTNVARFLDELQREDWWAAAAAASGDPALAQPQRGGCADVGRLRAGWRTLQRLSWEAPEAVWPAVLRHLGVAFVVPPARALLRHPSDPDRCRWLPGARLNVAAAALACPHPRAPPGTPAVVWAAEGRPREVHAIGRPELRARALHVAACVRARFKPGDALALYLPLTPDAVAAYLGVVLAGCVAVSVADSFSAPELRARLDIARAAGVITQDVVLRGGKALPLYDKVVQSGTAAMAVVLPAATPYTGPSGAATTAAAAAAPPPPPPALRPRDMAWADFMALAPPAAAAAAALPHIGDAYDTTNILFSSGTTGEPKAIPWTHLTPLRCAVDGWANLDVRPGGVLCWPTSLGWMMGPWLLYAALFNGATMAIYTGSPLGADFLHFVSAARVDVLGLVPSIVRAWRHGGVLERRAGGARGAGGDGGGGCGVGGGGGGDAGDGLPDLSCVRLYGSTGEASAAEDYHWLMSRARGYRPVIEYCGGTEIGGGYMSSTPLHPCAPSTFATPTLGCRVALIPHDPPLPPPPGGGRPVLDVDAAPAPGAAGEVALAMPMLGVSQRLLNRDHAQVYYEGMPLHAATGLPLRRHGDEMAALPAVAGGGDGGGLSGGGGGGVSYVARGRCDDAMNLGGIKVSSVDIERAVAAGVRGVVEAAAVGVAPPGGGPEELHLFLVLAPAGAGAGGGGGAAAVQAAEGVPQEQLAALAAQCNAAIRESLNPLFKASRVAVVPALPRNASNKVLRRVLRDAVPPRARM